jgi:hypothetical protein
VIISCLVDFVTPNEYLWFPRSGAILCMLSISAEFRLNQMDPHSLAHSVDERWELMASGESGRTFVTSFEKNIKLFTHISVAAGTIIWAYGDILFK